MIGTFLIFLREGIEGSMLISMMLAYLRAAGRQDLFRWVAAGVATAIAGAAAIGVLLYVLVRGAFVGSNGQTWFETGTFVVAVVILTYMTFWMRNNSRNLSGEIKEDMGHALAGRSGLALALVALVTVGREAIETAVFTLAIAFKSSGVFLLVGGAAGLAVALVITTAMYRVGIKVNLKRFFSVMGVLLLVVAGGLLANVVANLQQLGVLPGAGQVLWRTGKWLSDSTGAGDVLHGIIGYSAAPTALQVGVWAAFLVASTSIFLGAYGRIRTGSVKRVSGSGASPAS